MTALLNHNQLDQLAMIRGRARRYIGEREIPGSKDNPFIVECFKHTSYHADDDETAWCAAFVSRIIEECKMKSMHSARARDYKEWGVAGDLVPGAVIVLDRGGGKFHVTILDHVVDANTIACVGGNQSDSVRISNYSRSKIRAIRVPKAA